MKIFRTDVGYVVQHAGVVRRLVGDPFGEWTAGDELPGGLAGQRVLAPVVPSKIVAVALNYKAHAAEQGKPLPAEPLFFLKPSTAVIGHGEAIELPPGVGRVDHEAEVGLVIGRRASRVPADRAAEYILGVTCVNDVTARELQKKGGHYTRPKGFDTFAPVGPCIALGLDWSDLRVQGWVNGTLRQDSTTADLIFPVPELVAFISSVMTLLPGDIISTGTPSGIGPLTAGDTVRIRVEGVGDLTNPVV
ncbi:MAG: fumarylacetoacetate hydrolase family protein [Vicinamibacteria bacterium]|nr:fumarylacetoacetate hydrolase family protein [Vicinamibacteria bacterium]